MKINIDLSGLKKHFYNENEENEESDENIEIIDKKNKYTTKIVNYCFYSLNELKICNKIKEIPYYLNNFSIIEDYDYININMLNDRIIEKITLLDDNKRYLIFKYKKDDFVSFHEFLFHIKEPKMLIFHAIESFSYILQSLIKLNENNVCFFNLLPENISFNVNCGEKPILNNFQLSLYVSDLNEKYITTIIKKTKDYGLKPLEVHVLFYLIENNISTISYSFIEEITEVFIKNLTILSLFSENYRENYKTSCIESLKKYINKPKDYIINDILDQYDKWDVYSLSVIYLHIFGNISKVFSLKQTIIGKITIELSKNIHPDPFKRSSLNKLLENYNILFNSQKDWTIINKIENDKMDELFSFLEK
jgi:hypothetical protein